MGYARALLYSTKSDKYVIPVKSMLKSTVRKEASPHLSLGGGYPPFSEALAG